MRNQTVLISGAGIAGPTLAYWLARHGFRPTVVERATALRSSGSPVDVRGPAVDVAEQMGVMPRIRDAATDVTGMRFVNAAGRRVGRVNLRALQQAAGSREVELPRGDLASILSQASRDHAEFLFHDAIVALRQDEHGVSVTFDRAQPRRFDLVIGADGLHSAVRRLAFGPESDFAHHMGLYVATMRLGGLDGQDGLVEGGREVIMYNAPGRAVAIHPSRGDALAFFAFQRPAAPGFDYRDPAQHKRLLTAAFQGGGWRVPELLKRVQAADDLYFDSVSQVRVRPCGTAGSRCWVTPPPACRYLGTAPAWPWRGRSPSPRSWRPAPATTSWPSAATRPATGPWWTPSSATSRGPPRCSSRPRGPASWQGTWPPGCGRWAPPRDGCDAALPR